MKKWVTVVSKKEDEKTEGVDGQKDQTKNLKRNISTEEKKRKERTLR